MERRQIARVIRDNRKRTRIDILDDEMRVGAQKRANAIVEERRRREQAGRGTCEFNEDVDS